MTVSLWPAVTASTGACPGAFAGALAVTPS